MKEEESIAVKYLQKFYFNPSPPVLIYSRELQNAQSFDPSGSTWFYMQIKEEVDLSYEKKKKSKKKSLLWLRASYLHRKIILSGREAGRSRAASSLRLGSLGEGTLHRDDDEYLSFIKSFSKHYKTLEISIIYRKI